MIQEIITTLSSTDITPIIIALLAIVISAISLFSQKKHNRLSVRPLPFIEIGNYEDNIYVKIVNHGTGPFILKELVIKTKSKTIHQGVLIDYILTKGFFKGLQWETYVEDITKRPIAPNKYVTLLQIDPSNPDHIHNRDILKLIGENPVSIQKLEEQVPEIIKVNLRTALSCISIEVKGTDIYNKKVKSFTRDLRVFLE